MNKDYYNTIAGVTIDKGLDMLQAKLKEKEKKVYQLQKEIEHLKESNQKFALKNLKLKNKNKKASKIIADLKRKEGISDITALEKEVIRLIKENQRLKDKIDTIKNIL